ncbi:glycosyltransferase family 2 protein [Alcanivorax quisquiliarum]|uniref:Glycosyltransferase family 2 protein n=1 Tax=Alcanivorax quisquiliarum TaxID=2933565 RepID=A0ABT0E2Q4_9GAMM|nr:glycosyltransferase family 2 protein [Alcanivorax quisquiliarum]MCK0536101.1 glycosyltransferase family 2 protein [Alcanivorax quisquiliarum]
MKFSIVTPTYNRAHLINRVYRSLCDQGFRDFEWLVIDDGSSDNTEEKVTAFSEDADFPIKYYWKENAGKAAALNDALDHAEGEWFVVFDSDDWCVPNALERLATIIQTIALDDSGTEVAAISVLKVDRSGKVIGDEYKRYGARLSSYTDRFNLSVKGDKWEIIRTDVHRAHRYDIFPGEKYMAPEYAWLKIGVNYRTLFLDERLSIVEYQSDGISQNNIFHRSKSPNNTMRFYRLGFSQSRSLLKKMKMITNYFRFMLHRGRTPLDYLSFLFLPAFVFYIKDLYDLKKKAKK